METRHQQTIVRNTHCDLSLLVSGQMAKVRSRPLSSPFYRLKHCTHTEGPLTVERVEIPTSRDKKITFSPMKLIITSLNPHECDFDMYVGAVQTANDFVALAVSEPASWEVLKAAATTAVLAYGVSHSLSITAEDLIFPGDKEARSFSNPALAVNTARQASTTRDALVIASVEIDAALSLSGGAKGTVSLQYADNNTFTTNLKTASVGVNGNTGTLTVGLNTTQAGGGTVTGVIPAGKYYRLFTTNTTGTPTFGTPVVQEVLL